MNKLLLLLVFPMLLLAQAGNPPFQWVHPKPFGTSLGVVKIWDANTIMAFGSGGTMIKSTNGGNSWNLNPFAGQSTIFPYTTTNDIYAVHFFSRDTFITAGVYGAMKTTNGGQNFTPLSTGFGTSGTIRDITFANNQVGYLCGTSPVFKLSKTTDGGATWVADPVLPSTTYYTVYAFNANRVFVGGSSSASANIRFTTDGGTTWTATAAGTGTIYDIEFTDSLTGYAASLSGRGYKTTDGGTSWVQMTGLTAATSSTFYDIIRQAGVIHFVDDDSLLYTTTDGGTTFSSKRYLPVGNKSTIMRGADINGNTIVVVGDNGNISISSNGGTSWVNTSDNSGGSFAQGLSAGTNGKIIAIGTSPNQVMVSDNYGKTFTPVTLSVSGADLRDIYMFNNLNGFAVGSGGRIWSTTDGGYTWNLYAGTTSIQAFNGVHFYNQQYGFACANGGQMFKTTDGGLNWINVSIAGNTIGTQSVAMTDTNIIMVTQGTTVLRTTDGGANWAVITPGVPIGPISRIKMWNRNIGWLIGGSGTSAQGYTFKTTDGGLTWTNKNFPFSTNMLYNLVMRSDSDIVVTGFAGGVFHTTNNGSTWRQYNVGLPTTATQSQVIGEALVSRDTLLVGGPGAAIIKILLPAVVPVELTSFTSQVEPGKVVLSWTVASELNNRGFEVERKTAGSSAWISLSFIEGRGSITTSKTYSYTDNSVKNFSYQYRIKQIDFDGTTTYYNLPETVTIGVPAAFELTQNYPNPFNPTTVIEYSVPVKSMVTLTIYDILGKEVMSPVNGYHEPGRYKAEFNGAGLPSGVYIYKLSAGTFSKVMKMSLLK